MEPRDAYLLTSPPEVGPAELVALALGSGAGGRPAADIARELLDRHGSLAGIANASPRAIAQVRGVGPTRAVRLHAGLQAGRRSAVEESFDAAPIHTPDAAWGWFGPRLAGLHHEELHALLLDARHRPVGYRRLTSGSERATLVQPRQIARAALEVRAHAVVLAHNHPSGDPEPSAEDGNVTRRVAEGLSLLEIRLLDHLVVAGERFVSLAERGVVPAYGRTRDGDRAGDGRGTAPGRQPSPQRWSL
ncbi:MAG: RadC family protein [Myxococcota bacterium]